MHRRSKRETECRERLRPSLLRPRPSRMLFLHLNQKDIDSFSQSLCNQVFSNFRFASPCTMLISACSLFAILPIFAFLIFVCFNVHHFLDGLSQVLNVASITILHLMTLTFFLVTLRSCLCQACIASQISVLERAFSTLPAMTTHTIFARLFDSSTGCCCRLLCFFLLII